MITLTRSHQDDDLFKKMVARSLVFHVVVICLFTVKSFLFNSEPMIVESAIRVDMVALPDKITTEQLPAPPAPKEQPKPLPTAETKPHEIPKPTAVPLKKEAAKLDLKKKAAAEEAIKKMKALQAIEDSIKADERKKQQEAIQKARDNAAPYKGNVITPGTALKGLSRIQYDAYIHQLDGHVKSHWALPEWLANSDLTAVAVVKIDKAGVVISRSLVQSSGNSNYDAFVLKAIDDASPFPVPPEKFTAMLENMGIKFTFP